MKDDKQLLRCLEEELLITVYSLSPVVGGDIGHSFKAITGKGSFFVKTYPQVEGAPMIEAEALGLDLLNEGVKGIAPKVIAFSTDKTPPLLVLPFLGQVSPNNDLWAVLGRKLAHLHQKHSDLFGLSFKSYVGPLRQGNQNEGSFTEFLWKHQWQPLLGTLSLTMDQRRLFDDLHSRLERLIPSEPPSLVHGDLWSGNILFDKEDAYIIDPAVHYGHRESDLAMMELFGSVPRSFFRAYDELYPLAKDRSSRVDLFQVYPLLVHAKLFGSHYLRQALQKASVYL